MIQEMMDQYGWKYEIVAAGQASQAMPPLNAAGQASQAAPLLISSFTGEDGREYPFLLAEEEDTFSFMAICKRKPASPESELQDFRLLLRMNNEWPFLKLGLNEAQDAFTLSLDGLIQGCTFPAFKTLLDIFSEAVELFYSSLAASIEE